LAAIASGNIFDPLDIDPDDYVYGEPIFEKENTE